MSERLTTRLANGGVGYDNGEYFKVCYPWNEHCLTDIDRMAIKLCDLEDKICQGRMVELPCAVGDIVYSYLRSWRKKDGIAPYQITNITITQNKKGVWTKKYRAMQVENGKTIDRQLNFAFDEIGKIVFLTEAEAQNKLRDVQK